MKVTVAVVVFAFLSGVAGVAGSQPAARPGSAPADVAPPRSAVPPGQAPAAQAPAPQPPAMQPPAAQGPGRSGQQPAPAAAVIDAPPPGSEEYRLGPGDIVRISVYNNPDLATDAELSSDGQISFPLVGAVRLGGQTRAGAEKLISERLDSGGFVPKAHVNLLVLQYRSQQVSVMGEVHKPGKYSIGQGVGVADVLAMAGGVTPKGSQLITVIQKDRSGRTVQQEVDVKKLLAGRDASKEIRLGNEDVIFVPPMPVFYIYGEVRQPGSYPLAQEMTVRQALSVGGGLTVRGTERGIKVERKSKDGRVETLRAQLSDKLLPDDVVQVAESWF